MPLARRYLASSGPPSPPWLACQPSSDVSRFLGEKQANTERYGGITTGYVCKYATYSGRDRQDQRTGPSAPSNREPRRDKQSAPGDGWQLAGAIRSVGAGGRRLEESEEEESLLGGREATSERTIPTITERKSSR